MDSAKSSQYQVRNGVKPVNTYSKEILRNCVGLNAALKLKKSITQARLGPAGSSYNTNKKNRKVNTMNMIPKVMSMNIAVGETIDEEKEGDDEDIPIESYMVDSDNSGDSSGDDNGNAANENMTLAAVDGEFEQKDPQKLVDDDLNELLKICKDMSPPTEDMLKERTVTMGEKKRHKTLILDMDETLIHAEILPEKAKPIKDADFTITLKNTNANNEEETFVVYVKIRPFYDEWMETLANLYEIVVFTAGEQDYADAILDVLDTDKWINKRLYRQHCICVDEKYYVKDLRIIEDRELCDMVLVDNSIISMAFQIDNGIPVAPFYRTTKNDEELLFLHSYLDELYHVEDIRHQNTEKFKLKEIQDGTIKI